MITRPQVLLKQKQVIWLFQWIVAAAPTKPTAAPPKGPPKCALEGNKWVIENQSNNTNLVIDKAEIRHVVYVYNVIIEE